MTDNKFIDLADVTEVQFVCTICEGKPITLPIDGITEGEIYRTVVQHCHVEKGSELTGVQQDIAEITKFLAKGMKLFAEDSKRRNLKVLFGVKTD